MEESQSKKISSLREGEDNITVRVRVIKVEDPKVINTRKGPKRISEAIVGDDTGRIKLTLWGKHAGTLEEGEAVEIQGAWTTSYRGDVQLNVGYKGEIKRIDDEEVPKEDEVPEDVPKASGGWKPNYRGRQGGRRGYSGYRGSYSRREY